MTFPGYAEAAPSVFLDVLEEDLRSDDPKVHALMSPVKSGIFGSCPRTGLLWALEVLAWNPQCWIAASEWRIGRTTGAGLHL
jgi:hypothetical protein